MYSTFYCQFTTWALSSCVWCSVCLDAASKQAGKHTVFSACSHFSRILRQLRLLDVWKNDWELQICLKATFAFHSEYKIWLNYEKAVSGNTGTGLGSFSVKEGSHVLRTALYLCNLYLVLYLFAVFPEFHIYLFIYIKSPLSLSHVKSSNRRLLVTTQI